MTYSHFDPESSCVVQRGVSCSFCIRNKSNFMVRKGWSSMDVPSGWVQIIRGPRPLSQRGQSLTSRNHQSGGGEPSESVPTMPRQARVGPAVARDLAKNKIVQLERALEGDGWHGGAGSAEGTDFGQSRFSHPELTNFGQSNCGQSIFGSGVCHVPKGWGPNPEKIGPRRVGPPKGGGPKFRVFFFRLPPVSFFLSLTVCLLVVFWWCLEAPGPSNVHVWSSGVVV